MSTVLMPPDSVPQLSGSPPDAEPLALGSGIDLITDLGISGWEVRDQDDTGTCVAFAATACCEILHRQKDAAVPAFSEQFLFWAIKTQTDDCWPTSYWTKLGFARQALAGTGICHEKLLPTRMRAALPGSTVAGSPPSAAAMADARASTCSQSLYYDIDQGGQKLEHLPEAAARLLQCLQAGQPAAISIPVFNRDGDPSSVNNWTTNGARYFGEVADPDPKRGWKICGSHAVCVTWALADNSDPLGVYFVVRNSWGPLWGRDFHKHGLPTSGYGRISASYVNNWCYEILQLGTSTTGSTS